jgi:hypothetical protein
MIIKIIKKTAALSVNTPGVLTNIKTEINAPIKNLISYIKTKALLMIFFKVIPLKKYFK